MKNLKVCISVVICIGFLVLAWGTVPLQAQSSGYIYWANWAEKHIGRASLDTPELNPRWFPTGGLVYGVAVDEKYIYWANPDIDHPDPWIPNTTIGRANLDGSDPNPNFITGCWRPLSIAVDDQYIYWVNREEWDIPLPDPSYHQHTIGRAKLDGSEVNQAFIELTGCPRMITVANGFIYWANGCGNYIGRATVDGLVVQEPWMTTLTQGAMGVAVTKDYIFWTEDTDNIIARANLDGSNPELWLAGLHTPMGIGIKDDFLYSAQVDAGGIIRGNINDPSSIDLHWRTGQEYCGQIALTPERAHYAFEGFFSPIDKNSVNTVNAGQTIPVKWKLTDKTGLPVSDPASFVSIKSLSTDCATYADDPINYVDEPAAGSAGLQYLGDGWWQYNWKTSKTYTGQCRIMKLTLDDGSVHTANFSFK